MLNQKEILSTIAMIDQQHLDIRTITMGISLLSCCDPDAKKACDKIYEKITRYAEKLVKTGEDIQHEFGIPIVNKRISVTPMALVAGASETEDYVPFALALDRAAKTCGVNFIGGYSALVQKGMTLADEKLIRSIPEALDRTELVCSSINVGSTRAGINMDAVKLMGRIIKDTAARTADRDGHQSHSRRYPAVPLWDASLPDLCPDRHGELCTAQGNRRRYLASDCMYRWVRRSKRYWIPLSFPSA